MLTKAIKYGTIGVVNSLVGLSLIFFALSYGASDIAANVAGYSVGLFTSFLLNRSWSFAYRGGIAKNFVKFVIVMAVAYLCNLLVVLLLHRTIGLNVYLAQLAGACVTR